MNKEIVGMVAGNFDLLHPGYIYTFEEAKRHCDKFLVFLPVSPFYFSLNLLSIQHLP